MRLYVILFKSSPVICLLYVRMSVTYSVLDTYYFNAQSRIGVGFIVMDLGWVEM